MASPLPARLTFEEAATLPLALSTAACGLFEKHLLSLRLPGQQSAGSLSREWVVVWGASTNVGGNSVQLAANAGYDVIAIASTPETDRVLSLGARHVVDRHDPAPSTGSWISCLDTYLPAHSRSVAARLPRV